MSNGKRITIVEVYNQMVKGFNDMNNKIDDFKKEVCEEFNKLRKDNNLK